MNIGLKLVGSVLLALLVCAPATQATARVDAIATSDSIYFASLGPHRCVEDPNNPGRYNCFGVHGLCYVVWSDDDPDDDPYDTNGTVKENTCLLFNIVSRSAATSTFQVAATDSLAVQ